ncbi:pantoate--beta-alanine ligase [Calditerricola satsumensis]|uniref:Pantothenate synthetase n=1 Tax=Calditerricola satsumensis TaxID=373054 RepID=A0A8J3B8T9_9BACI|nr:pantoate--beta-alanine ligase [Calditerricola satsumensis]GGJ96316.1 pantothenate synthetase [Calditerricola satsumensis]
MKVVKRIDEVRAAVRQARQEGKRIGFVPTMGYLHEGHLSLIDRAREMTDYVVMSIFVNPLQFGPNEDYDRYPRDLERDERMARQRGVDLLFAPDVAEMYPEPIKTTVHVADLSAPLCGASRPGHFDGVATVVLKLFHIVQPDYAFFGLKDAQQVAVVSRMVRDLNVPVTIVPCPIVREADGLAMSSRNVYLSPEERRQATVLYESLQWAKEAVATGLRDWEALKRGVRERIAQKPLAEIDYVDVLAYPDLVPPRGVPGEQVLIAVAVRFGRTRLIDNALVTLE